MPAFINRTMQAERESEIVLHQEVLQISVRVLLSVWKWLLLIPFTEKRQKLFFYVLNRDIKIMAKRKKKLPMCVTPF